MWKRLALMGIGFLVLLAVLVLINIGLAKRQSGTPTSSPEATAPDWARSMLQKSSSYEKGSYSGVLPTGKADEIWIIGKKVSTGLYPNNIYVVNDMGQYFAKINPDTKYSTQVGDDFVDSYPSFIEPGTIIVGDDIAIRTTFVDNFPSALEVRRLVRVQPSD